ncbi:hypothetical protein PUNSTDRAFT_53828, partial [Punctularia strigosozonata HHB-11173 SS5]|uniref:uncharacterized protein n=1 Tax=Punctularia strigosozonata (strain HHB-11173) TaxID=741275 RepID=UPI000441740C
AQNVKTGTILQTTGLDCCRWSGEQGWIRDCLYHDMEERYGICGMCMKDDT